GMGGIRACGVGKGYVERVASPQAAGEGALRLLDDDVGRLTAELETLVPQEGPREEASLAQDLEAVAAAEYEPAAGHEPRQRADDRRAARHRARPQVVAVGETPWQDQAIEAFAIGVPVPHVLDRLVEHLGDDVVEIHVTPCAREDHDAESHAASCSDEVAGTPSVTRPGNIRAKFYYAARTRTRRRTSPRPRDVVAVHHF